MNKIIKRIVIIGLSLYALYFVYSISSFAYYGHSTELTNYKRYLWLFKDSVKSDVDTFFVQGEVNDRDIYYHYILKKDYFVSLWEFKDLGYIDLNSIKIDTSQYLGATDFESSETFNPRSWPRIKSELGFEFKDYFGVKVNKASRVTKLLKTPRYVGFIGNVWKLTFQNKENRNAILFDYDIGGRQSLFLFYKTRGSFFVIIVNSRDIPFDESILDCLNLE